MDTSKRVFQLHGVNTAEELVLRKKLRRKEMFAFFQKLARTDLAIDACGGLTNNAPNARSVPWLWEGVM